MGSSRIDSTFCGEINDDQVSRYSCVDEARRQFQDLLSDRSLDLPQALKDHARDVVFTSSHFTQSPIFPCPFKQTESVAILKAVESSIVAAIADARYGVQKRRIVVSLDKCARYLMSAYMCTVDGKGKLDPTAKSILKSMASVAWCPVINRD
jgi:hypothetical protein